MAEEYWESSLFGKNSYFAPGWDEKQKEERLKENKGVEILGFDIYVNYLSNKIKLFLPPSEKFNNSSPIISDEDSVIIPIKAVVLLDKYAHEVKITIDKKNSITAKKILGSTPQYEADFNVKIYKSKARIDQYNSQEFIFNASVRDIFTKEVSDTKSAKVKIDTNGDISNVGIIRNESCGIEYRNKVKCTKYNGVYGPVHWGSIELNKYPSWNQLVDDNYITNNERDILIGMSKNEGKIDGVQSYDSEVVTVGAMQKTLKNNGQGQFYIQVLEFKNQNKALFENIFEKCGWKIENNKLTYNGMYGQDLKNLIRKGFNKDVYGLSIPSIPLEPLIKACNNPEFQKKQILDFVDALNTVLEFYPLGYLNKINEYFLSNFSMAVILDQYVNRPNYVKTDLGNAMDRFFTKNPSYSKLPNEWKNNHYDYELEIMEDYGKNRRGTNMENRYNNLKEYFLR